MDNSKDSHQKSVPTLSFDIGHHEIIIRKRYEFYYNLNDILIAVWFIIGSLLFFSENLQTAGTWLFLIGSIELLIRPFIRMFRKTHLKRLGPSSEEEL